MLAVVSRPMLQLVYINAVKLVYILEEIIMKYKRFKSVPFNPEESQRLHVCVDSPVSVFIQDWQEYFKPIIQ